MKLRLALNLTLAAALNWACTSQLPGSFRFLQQEESFSSSIDVNTKIDLLWVVDNSASMDVSQNKLREGFRSFAETYMNPNWDIRVAVITTDTYLANSAFSTYLDTTISGTVGYTSTYIDNKVNAFVNPSWNTTLVDSSTGVFTNGIKYGELVPVWGTNWSRLLSGYHDGPVTGLCAEIMPYFYDSDGITDCSIRDDSSTYTGTEDCLDPPAGQSAIKQCVNTIQNDTVRSGKAIIETIPPDGTEADDAWVDQLVDDFMVNLSTGSVGHGSERGLSSVQQLLDDNEDTTTAFFREGSLRGIIFVSDEEDQSINIPDSPPAGFTPFYNYACDASGISANNGAMDVAAAGLCCTGGTCTYGNAGTTCSSKTVDDYTYTISVCPDEDELIPVSTFKDSFDSFFRTLDGDDEGDPNYFIVSIVALDGDSIEDLQTTRLDVDSDVGATLMRAGDRADRYLDLGDLVGNGSLELNIAEDDYSSILEEIGNTITLKKGLFELNLPASSKDEMYIKVVHSDGTEDIVDSEDYELDGSYIQFTNLDFILSFKSDDQIYINYQPGAQYK